MSKRQVRCSYCWQSGHNRTSCPKVKAEAANGDSYAKRLVERSSVKQCSYCRGTDHNKAGCDKLFSDQRNEGLIKWAHLNAMINVIKTKKIANGAFIYGPIIHRWNDVPYNTYDGEPRNYDLGNYCVKHIAYNDSTPYSSCYGFETLVEPSGDARYFRTNLPLPGIYNEVQNLSSTMKEAVDLWNNHQDRISGLADSRINRVYEENYNVLVEASDEEVNKVVESLLMEKPAIVDFTERKPYQSEMRKRKKESQ